MGLDSTSETCITCSKKPIHFYKIPDSDGDSQLSICRIICQHFWFRKVDLQNSIVCETCWEQVDQFHKFYLEVKNLHEQREVVPASMFIKQEEITLEETRIQENCIDVSVENQKLFSILDCKHEMPEDCDELSTKKVPTEIFQQLRKKQKFVRRLPITTVVKRTNLHTRKMLTPEERQVEDDFIKQHTRYICDECNIEFKSFRAIKIHQKGTHKIAHIMCCGNQYRTRSILYQHVQSLLNPEAFKCDICGKSFKSKISCIRHKEENHATEEDLVFKCHRCSKRFIRERLLRRHLEEHRTLENETAKCEFCDKCFRRKHHLKAHVKAVHKKPMDFICEVCSMGFYMRGMFLAHRKTHELTAEQLKEQCPVCNKWLKNHRNWLLHMQRHKGGECKCEVCGHVSKNMISLKKHRGRNHGPNKKQHV